MFTVGVRFNPWLHNAHYLQLKAAWLEPNIQIKSKIVLLRFIAL